uniref:Uncharacterized protein n=1 Tax=Myotis myotis TaxID=51298 RepID=A0A7J7QVN9_MYOMY|nr:hypothetical protein mMyoMyo1_011542 [Myotis myotis]
MGAQPPCHSSLIPRSPSTHFHSRNQRTEHRSTPHHGLLATPPKASFLVSQEPVPLPPQDPGPLGQYSVFWDKAQSVEKSGMECPSVDKWIITHKTVVRRHRGILCSREKGGSLTPGDSTEGPGGHDAERNKPIGERHISHDLTPTWSLK